MLVRPRSGLRPQVLAAAAQACWLLDRRAAAAGFAVFATLWPGWPFVAVLFAPLGIGVAAAEMADRGLASGFLATLRLGVAWGLVIGAPVAAVDAWFYGARTSPLWNAVKHGAPRG